MPKLSDLTVILRENFTSDQIQREPEPNLIMEDGDQVKAFTEAGRAPALLAVYAYHAERVSQVLHGAKRVVDLGCGSGVFLIKLARLNPDIQFIGFDLSPTMLNQAKLFALERDLKNIEFRQADFTDLSEFDNQSLDGVVSLQAFHHLPNHSYLEKLYSEVGRVLKPDGALYFQDLIRMKSLNSVMHFAHYDEKAPLLTREDGVHSMKAAFLFKDFVEVSKKYLPKNVSSYKTACVDLYMVQKTPFKKLSEEKKQRIQAYIESLPKEARKIYKDLKLFHRLGGLK